MTVTSLVHTNSKTAEFARLFDLFDRVATRRARALTGDNSEVISTDDLASVPAEFAPVLRNLSTILALRSRRPHAASASTTKPRHNTPIGTSSATFVAENSVPQVDVRGLPGEIEEDENPSFPPGQRYPFTFKLMLHKLYDLEEWAEKVETAVEASKSQFKPLAERDQNIIRGTSTGPAVSVKERGERRGRSSVRPVLGTSAKFKPPSVARQGHSGAVGDVTASIKERGERRSGARPVLGTSAKFKPPSTSRHPRPTATPIKPEANRVLKKRCIGRRKSINGPMASGVWVYDAAISAIEIAGSRPVVEITLSAPKGHCAGSMADNRARHRSLTAVEDIRGWDIAKHKIKITVSLPQEERAEQASLVSLAELAQVVTKTGGMVKKRRSVVSSVASESRKRTTVKRPLCV